MTLAVTITGTDVTLWLGRRRLAPLWALDLLLIAAVVIWRRA